MGEGLSTAPAEQRRRRSPIILSIDWLYLMYRIFISWFKLIWMRKRHASMFCYLHTQISTYVFQLRLLYQNIHFIYFTSEVFFLNISFCMLYHSRPICPEMNNNAPLISPDTKRYIYLMFHFFIFTIFIRLILLNGLGEFIVIYKIITSLN